MHFILQLTISEKVLVDFKAWDCIEMLWFIVCSSGMTCPAASFVEASFLQTVKGALSQKGLFIANLVSRSQTIKDSVISRMKEVRMQIIFYVNIKTKSLVSHDSYNG